VPRGDLEEVLAARRRRFNKRFLAGCLLIVAAAGVGTAGSGAIEVTKLVTALRRNTTIHVAHNVLAPTAPGRPQTLLLVGDDRRPALKTRANAYVPPHSNEMLLVRLDPERPTISMLSIPRDLQVPIYAPNRPPIVTRINAAYTFGGVGLMVKTIKRILGVSINHVVVMTFPHFRRAVDEMDCVYSTVDRRYYHVNVPGGEQYFEVNLQPGYQRLCGSQALQFVAYRHGDTALIRDARDQRFLLDAKAEYGPSLVDERDKFEQIFGQAVQTDIHSNREVLDLLDLLIEMRGRPVRQSKFKVHLGPTVTASQADIQQSVQQWLHGTGSVVRRPVQPAAPPAPQAPRRPGAPPPRSPVLVPTPESQLAQAKAAGANLPFSLEYPRVLNQYAGAGPNSLRLYSLHDLHGGAHKAYVVVVDRGRLGEFYDVQGTTWRSPPILRSPTETVRVGARKYQLHYDGDRLRIVAWRERGARYWISNTLSDSVSAGAMLAMAGQTTPLAGRAAAARAETRPAIPQLSRRRSTVPSTALSRVGALIGLGSLVLVALLAVRVFRTGRSLREVRVACEEMDRLRSPRQAPQVRP